MILWFQQLPKKDIDLLEWTPFIQNNWFQMHFMKFVYLLQIMIILTPLFFTSWFPKINIFTLILIGICVFIVHELIHIVAVYKKGDISLTYRDMFFWLDSNAILSKMRFFIFMSMPFIVLSVLPAIASFYVSGNIKSFLIFVSSIDFIIPILVNF